MEGKLLPDFEKEHRQNLVAISSLKSEELQQILKRILLYIMSVTCFSLASMLGSLTKTMYPRNNFGALVASPGRNSSSLPTWWEFVQYVLATVPRRSVLSTPRKFRDNFDALWPTGRMSTGDPCLSIALLAQLVTMSFFTLKSWRWLTWICDRPTNEISTLRMKNAYSSKVAFLKWERCWPHSRETPTMEEFPLRVLFEGQ